MGASRAKQCLGGLAISMALAACGGGDGGNGSGDAGTGSPATPVAPVTPTAVTYTGVISFGDTIAVTLDAPAAGQVKIRFADSTFGLGGTLIGTYSMSAGQFGYVPAAAAAAGAGAGVYTVSGLMPDRADPPPITIPPAALVPIQATFAVSGATLTGEISGLPNLLGTGGGNLAGHINASSTPVLAPRSSLAGTYAFMITLATYSADTGHLMFDAQYAGGGQMRLRPDGTMRMCLGGKYSDTCPSAWQGFLVPADQTRFPGAYEFNVGGEVYGRVFAAQVGGVQTLYLDRNVTNISGNKMTGTLVFRPLQTLANQQMDGSWACSQPGVTTVTEAGTGNTIPVLDGTLRTAKLTIAGADIRNETTGDVSSLALNYGELLSSGSALMTQLDGMMAADWPVAPTVGNPSPGTRPQVFLPIDAKTMAYYTLVPNAQYYAQGMCRKAG